MIDSDEQLQRLADEYVLGTLSMAERAEVEQRLLREPALRDAVDAWEQRLLPLTTLAPSLTASGRSRQAPRTRRPAHPRSAH